MKRQRFVLFFIALILASSPLDLRAATDESQQQDELVEITYPIDVMAPYKDRRRTHGANFGVNFQQYVPNLWESLIDEEYYEDVYGDTPIGLMSIEGGYKFNFDLGSISLMAGGGYGEASVEAFDAVRFMRVTKYYGRAMFILDNIMAEPYLAPYVAGSAWQMQIVEGEDISDAGGTQTTGVGFDYTFGVLLQLNWIEQDLARQSLVDLGIENTYIDLFATQYLKSMNSSDPSTATTDFALGAGLRLEF